MSSPFCLFLYLSPPLQLNKANGPPSPQPGTLGRVAAVGPYIQVPVPGQQQGGYNMPPDPLKPQTLGINTQPPHGRSSKSGKVPHATGAHVPGRGLKAWVIEAPGGRLSRPPLKHS